MSRHAACYIRRAGHVGPWQRAPSDGRRSPHEELDLAAEPELNGAAAEWGDLGLGGQELAAREPLQPDPDSDAALLLSRRIVDLAADKLASDILLLDIRGVSPIADYFVICTAGSERQTAAILNDLRDKLLVEQHRKPLHTEGQADSGWVLLDYGDVIAHVFSPAQRAFYNLEELWAAATPVVRMQ